MQDLIYKKIIEDAKLEVKKRRDQLNATPASKISEDINDSSSGDFTLNDNKSPLSI
jgi:hypothetical protein